MYHFEVPVNKICHAYFKILSMSYHWSFDHDNATHNKMKALNLYTEACKLANQYYMSLKTRLLSSLTQEEK